MRALPLLFVAATLAVPAPAQAAGTYAGWILSGTGSDDTMVATTDDAGKRVREIAIAFRAGCEDDQSFAFHRTIAVRRQARMDRELRRTGAVLVPERNRQGAFRAAYGGLEGAGTQTFMEAGRVVGTFGPERASGTLRIEIDVIDDATDEVVTSCDTGRLRWTLRRGRGRVYGGTSSQEEPIAMFLRSNRRSVREFGIGWHADCTGGGFVDVPDDLINFPIRGGRFGDDFEYVDPDGNRFVYRFRGRVTRRTAAGTIAIEVTAPSGESCSTGVLRWSARSG